MLVRCPQSHVGTSSKTELEKARPAQRRTTEASDAKRMSSPKGMTLLWRQLKEYATASSVVSEGERESVEIGGDSDEQLLKQARIVQELIATEKSFRDGLSVALDEYDATLSGSTAGAVLTPEQSKLLFGNMRVLHSLSNQLIADLEAVQADPVAVCRAIASLGPFLKLFCEYCDAHPKRLDLLADLRTTNNSFNEVLTGISQRPNAPRQSLDSCLILPIQRVPRYVLLLDELNKAMTAPPAECLKARELVKDIAQRVNESLRQRENAEKLCEIQRSILTLPAPPTLKLTTSSEGMSRTSSSEDLSLAATTMTTRTPKDIFTTNRMFVREDHLSLVRTSLPSSTVSRLVFSATRKVILFSDVMLFGPISSLVGKNTVVSPTLLVPLAASPLPASPLALRIEFVVSADTDERDYVELECCDEASRDAWVKDVLTVADANNAQLVLAVAQQRTRKDSVVKTPTTPSDNNSIAPIISKPNKRGLASLLNAISARRGTIVPSVQQHQADRRCCQSCMRSNAKKSVSSSVKKRLLGMKPSKSASTPQMTLALCIGCGRAVCEECRPPISESSGSEEIRCFACEALHRAMSQGESQMRDNLQQSEMRVYRRILAAIIALVSIPIGFVLLGLLWSILNPPQPEPIVADVHLSLGSMFLPSSMQSFLSPDGPLAQLMPSSNNALAPNEASGWSVLTWPSGEGEESAQQSSSWWAAVPVHVQVSFKRLSESLGPSMAVQQQQPEPSSGGWWPFSTKTGVDVSSTPAIDGGAGGSSVSNMVLRWVDWSA